MKPRLEPVLVVHHTVPPPGSGPNAESDAGVMDEVRDVAAALKALGVRHRIAGVGSIADLTDLLRSSPEDTVFNLIENLPPRPMDAALVPSICEAFGKACTGNDTPCQALCLDKRRAKAILQAAGLPVPAGVPIAPGTRVDAKTLPSGPFIVKPLFTDASEGIHADSVVPAAGRALDRVVRRIHRDFRHTALVEQFFGTRELNVSVIDRGGRPEVLPLAEIEFRGYGTARPHIVDYAAKWHPDSFEYRNTVRVLPAKLDRKLADRVRRCALAAWETLGCADFARVDLRLADDGRFVILEVNPNPDISPESGFAAALKAAGIPFPEFVRAMVLNAQRRRVSPVPPPAKRKPSSRRRTVPPTAVRYTVKEDQAPILKLLEATRFFRKDELEVAREVLDDALKHGPTGHYQSFALTERGKTVGWVCLGATPCTVGAFDVYWLGVDPACQGKGYGRLLLEYAEKVIRRRKGRLIVIETSGHSLYDTTRGFYLALGYREVARVPDFYGPGDARVIYTKALLFT